MSKGVLLMKEKQHKKINKFLMEKAYSDHIKEKGGRIPPAKSPELSGLSATYTAMPSWFPVMTRSLKEKAKKVVYIHPDVELELDMETQETTITTPPIKERVPTVYVIQEISGTREGRPKINILGAAQYGTFKFLLPEMAQIIFSPGPLIYKLRKGLKEFRSNKDSLLLTGDPAIIGVACSIVSDITNGKYKLLKWDKQERKYYPIEINLHERGNIDDDRF